MTQHQSSLQQPIQPNRFFAIGMIILLLFYWLVLAVFLERFQAVDAANRFWLLGDEAPSFFVYFVTIFHWRILRHLIPVVIGAWLAYDAAIGAVKLLYEFSDRDSAKLFLSRLRAPQNVTETIGVNFKTLEQDRPKSVLLRIGGPGKVKVGPSDVVVTEMNGRFHRILGAGKHLLMPYEFVHIVMDLRAQERRVPDVTLRTRDNIPLTANLNIKYRLKRGEQPASMERPFPFDPESIHKAAYVLTVFDNGTTADWTGRAPTIVQSTLRNTIAEYRLDEIMHPLNQGSEPYTTLRNEVFRKARAILRNDGIELEDLQLEKVTLPEEVEQLYISNWQAHWQSQADLHRAEGEATYIEEIEIAQAEAEVAMMQAILEGIQRARRSGATTRTSEIVALRLVESLEKMAAHSRTIPRPLQSQLNAMHHEIYDDLGGLE